METENTTRAFSPQYFIINKSEPRYELLKNQLLNNSPHPHGSSYYFIRAGENNCCVCRIKTGNGSVIFYEILNSAMIGISEQEIREAVKSPSLSSPLPGYYYLTPALEEKIRVSNFPEYHTSISSCPTRNLSH